MRRNNVCMLGLLLCLVTFALLHQHFMLFSHVVGPAVRPHVGRKLWEGQALARPPRPAVVAATASAFSVAVASAASALTASVAAASAASSAASAAASTPEQQFSKKSAHGAARALLRAAAQRNVTLGIVQVGACDGAWKESNDPVQELFLDPRVRALALEPVPHLFSTLERRVAALPDSRGRLLVLNTALCLETKDAVPFFVVDAKYGEDHPHAPHWTLHELGSFDREHLKRHHIPYKYIKEVQVPCLAPTQLFAERFGGREALASLPPSPLGPGGARAVDLLIVDAEGLDADLVEAMLKVEGFRPRAMIFERKHIKKRRLKQVLHALESLGYELFKDHAQQVAVWRSPKEQASSGEVAGEARDSFWEESVDEILAA